MRTKNILILISLFTLVACVVFAATVDGKWAGETTIKNKKKNTEQTLSVVTDLTTEGSTVAGSVTAGSGRRPKARQIQDGKIDGDQISFTTTQKTKKGERKQYWSGTVSGDQMELTRKSKPNARRGLTLTLKRQ